mmetsp:Transcript_11714/g.13441  ORF Transcript_11714/g.13441 Transcript_11714/m.13441 type:complete len:129 (-) Transcript_11714:60-446(-)
MRGNITPKDIPTKKAFADRIKRATMANSMPVEDMCFSRKEYVKNPVIVAVIIPEKRRGWLEQPLVYHTVITAAVNRRTGWITSKAESTESSNIISLSKTENNCKRIRKQFKLHSRYFDTFRSNQIWCG